MSDIVDTLRKYAKWCADRGRDNMAEARIGLWQPFQRAFTSAADEIERLRTLSAPPTRQSVDDGGSNPPPPSSLPVSRNDVLEEAALTLDERADRWADRKSPTYDGRLSDIMVSELKWHAGRIRALKGQKP